MEGRVGKAEAYSFVETLRANVDNLKMDDHAFRCFVKNSLEVVETTKDRSNRRKMEQEKIITHIGYEVEKCKIKLKEFFRLF